MSENNKQLIEVLDEELDQIAGGVVRISGNTNRVAFSTLNRIYALKNCTAIEARNLCESLMAKYPGETEHEAACESALKSKGWI